MKKTILYYVLMALIVAIIFTRCKGVDAKASDIPISHSQKSDTSFCLGYYLSDKDSVSIFPAEMTRITNSALLPSRKDSMVNEWVRDTFYVIIQQDLVTKEIAEQYLREQGVKIEMTDSLGKPRYVPRKHGYNKRFVRNGWTDVDSAIAQLKRIKL
jgi:hypothetical protein